MTEPEQQPTQHDDWVSDRDRGQKLHNMLQRPGWTEVLSPALESRREGLAHKLLICDSKDMELVRQSINAVDSLDAFIKVILAIGEKAAENLKKETEEDEDE